MLQEGQPYNDVLLYWPVYDLWMGGGNREERFTVHHPDWIEATSCGEAGRWMIDQGYTFDFVSDAQLLQTHCKDHSLQTGGGNEYRAVLVPAAQYMKIETARHLLDLARAGATVLVWKGLPQDVPGWKDHALRKERLDELIAGLAIDTAGVAAPGSGKVIVGDQLEVLLRAAGIAREPLVDHRLKFIRRTSPSFVTYFIANHSAVAVNEWISIASPCRSAVLMDPMTAAAGVAPLRVEGDHSEIYLQMHPGETRVLRAFRDQMVEGPAWPIREPSGTPRTIEGPWQLRFVEGGPVLPGDVAMDRLTSWTQVGDVEAERFAGAVRYTVFVTLPDIEADGWYLDLGDVRESARVWVNGRPAGVVVAHPFRIDVAGLFHPGVNELAIEVTNLSANRIRDLDRRGVKWKKFHDINLVDHLYQPFDASGWDLKPSGLLGPVTLTPYRTTTNERPAK
ncbi:MAG: hypothetical protein JJ992_30050 [Planctomycetes bacterium]|nr:hypothetical protein [Planctomycetota bacterium]